VREILRSPASKNYTAGRELTGVAPAQFWRPQGTRLELDLRKCSWARGDATPWFGEAAVLRRGDPTARQRGDSAEQGGGGAGDLQRMLRLGLGFEGAVVPFL
jgi:hypothetical protein